MSALLKMHDFAGDPEELVRRLCRELLEEIYGRPPTIEDLPVDLEMAASFRGAVLEVSPGGPAGSIRHDGTRYVIRLRGEDSAGRRQFSGGHEISHIPFLVASGNTERIDDGKIGRFDWSHQEEYLCDVGAAELVMPESALRPLIPPQPTMDVVLRIAELCGTSVEATARRVVGLSPLDGTVIVLTESLKPTEVRREAERAMTQPLFPDLAPQAPQRRLRVKYSAGGGPFIPPHKSVADGCDLLRVLTDEAIDYVGPTGLVAGPLAISARYLPMRENGNLITRVVAIAFDPGRWAAAA